VFNIRSGETPEAGGFFLHYNWGQLQMLPALGVYEIAAWVTDCTGQTAEESYNIDLIEQRL